jgi:hypothetical protein
MKLITKLSVLFLSFRTLFLYLDPGSGSLIIQLIIAGIVGLAATFRFWKSKFLSLFGIRSETKDDEDETI